MKKKFIAKLATLVLLFVVCLVGFVGCGTPAPMPKSDDPVTGNGGLAVQKGEYLYFVNGYTAISDMKEGDNTGDENYSGIYRAKLGENNSLSYDEDGKLKDCTKIVGKVAGFDKTKLYIFGDYIYYASPNTEKVIEDDEAKDNFKYTDFYSAKLDGSGVSHLYKSTTSSDSMQFAFYKTNASSDVNLVVFDGTKIVSINCSNKSATTVVENASSVAMPAVVDYNQSNNSITVQESAIYYTRSANESEKLSSGNIMAYFEIGKNQEQIITKGINTYAVKSVNKEALVFTMKNADGKTDANACNFYATFDQNGKAVFDENTIRTEQRLDYTAHDKVFLVQFENGICRGFVTVNANNLLVWFDTFNDTIEILNEDKSLTPLCIDGNYVYAYDSDNSLLRVNYKTKSTEVVYDSTKELENVDEDAEDKTVPDIYFSAGKNFSICSNYAYFYIPYKGDSKTGYYLNRISLVKGNANAELVGVVQSSHIKTKTEN